MRFAEVVFFFVQKIDHHRKALALVSLFGHPNEDLRASSSDTLWVCEYRAEDSLVVVDAKSIQSTISMTPFPPADDQNPTNEELRLFFVYQDTGFDIADLDHDHDDS